MSIDPLGQIIRLLRPSAAFSKLVTATGRWAVRPPADLPFYSAVLEGEVELTFPGEPAVRLAAGDFVMIPAARDFIAAGIRPPFDGAVMDPVETAPGVFHLGWTGEPDTRMLVGYCRFGGDDAALLVSLLPKMMVVRGEGRLTMLVELLSDEARAVRPGRDEVLARLLEVLLIEAFRASKGPADAPGLLRGLADDQVAIALRCLHGEPRRAWTVADLASEAAMSRSAFFDRFKREVGVAPMEYLLGWRMALAKDYLRDGRLSVAQVAQRVGYGSQSTFSVAFGRTAGRSPTAYAREHDPLAQETPEAGGMPPSDPLLSELPPSVGFTSV
jgi:AraC-like DNA-binding protein